MGSRTSGGKSQTYKIKKVQEVLKESEEVILKCLRGEMKVPDKFRVQVATELYKRRVPNTIEKSGAGSGQLTVVKIVKNHLPPSNMDTVEVEADKVEEQASRLIKQQKEKVDGKRT